VLAAMTSQSGPVPTRDPFTQRVVTTVLILVVAGLFLTLAVLGIGVLLAAFAGVLVAVVLNAATRVVVGRTPLPYGWSLGIVILLIAGFIAGTGWLLGGQVAEQADEFGAMLPQVAADVESYLQQHGWGKWLLQQMGVGGGNGGSGADDGGGGGGAMALTALGMLSNAFSYLLVALFVGIFGAANPALYLDGIVGLTPPRHRDRMRELLAEIGHTLRRWLLGQFMAMVLIGVSTTIVLWLFGVPLAIVTGLIVGLLGFVPYLGPIIGVIPVAIVAGPEGATTLLWVLLAYTGVQMVEGYGLTPLIFEHTVYLPPVFTIITQILLGAVLGVKGIILATPLAAVALVLSRAYRRDILGDDDVPLRPSGA
jgi:predicted PurR-regulated permease PerM